MLENFTERIITSADTREKAAKALGFDEPPIEEKLSRSDFKTDEEYFHACAELSLRNRSPEYREAYRKTRREFYARKEAEAQEAAEEKHREELERAIKNCVLRPEEQQRVDDEARSRAQADLASGRISFQQIGATVEQYAEKLTEAKKREKVHTEDINRQLRKAIAGATGRKL